MLANPNQWCKWAHNAGHLWGAGWCDSFPWRACTQYISKTIWFWVPMLALAEQFHLFHIAQRNLSLHFSANFPFTISNYYPQSQVTPSTWSQYPNLYLCHMIANRIPVQKIHGNCRDWGFLHPEVEDFHSQKPSAEDICLSHPDPGTKQWNIVIAISYSYPYYSVIIHNLHCSN